jgi:PKD repeat protein
LTNECGTVSFFENVTITAYPDAAFSSDYDFVCAPAEIQFNDLSEDDVDTWLWTFEGGNPAFSSEQNPVVSYFNSGTYAVELIVNNNFGSDTIQIADAAIVNEEAVANFEFSVSQNSAEFTNSSNIGGDVFWGFGDMATSSEDNPTHVYSDPGEYLVTMIIDGGSNCVDTISQLVQILTVGIEESMEFSCKVYPVPARSQFFVEIVTNISDEMLLGITNTLGQQIDSRLVTLQKGMKTYQFDNQYPSGLYLITLSSKYERYLLKLIID